MGPLGSGPRNPRESTSFHRRSSTYTVTLFLVAIMSGRHVTEDIRIVYGPRCQWPFGERNRRGPHRSPERRLCAPVLAQTVEGLGRRAEGTEDESSDEAAPLRPALARPTRTGRSVPSAEPRAPGPPSAPLPPARADGPPARPPPPVSDEANQNTRTVVGKSFHLRNSFPE